MTKYIIEETKGVRGYEVSSLSDRNIGRGAYNRVTGSKAIYASDLYRYMRSIVGDVNGEYARIKAVLRFLDLLEQDFADAFGSGGAPLPEGYVETFKRMMMGRITGEEKLFG